MTPSITLKNAALSIKAINSDCFNIILQAPHWGQFLKGKQNKFKKNNANTMINFNIMAIILGIAWVGTICQDPNYRTAVVEYFRNDMQTAEVPTLALLPHISKKIERKT
jgi:hypothetical protein